MVTVTFKPSISVLDERPTTGRLIRQTDTQIVLETIDGQNRPRRITRNLSRVVKIEPEGGEHKPRSVDFDNLADRISRLKTEEEIYMMLRDLNATELAKLASKFPGEPTVLFSSRIRNAINSLKIPQGLSINARRLWLAHHLITNRRDAWR